MGRLLRLKQIITFHIVILSTDFNNLKLHTMFFLSYKSIKQKNLYP